MSDHTWATTTVSVKECGCETINYESSRSYLAFLRSICPDHHKEEQYPVAWGGLGVDQGAI